ncbi:hypothetical protein LJB84_01475 [Bacteroidales bacterium OttesenSCG-928-J19]|nr:hypothetical protein [Bacteroidales bacterium OttesenSCG-928-J19]
MSGRLQLIEQKLTVIDAAGFQSLCDAYLSLRETEYRSYNRTGSQLGKQKTIKGTPDTFMRLSDNLLVCVEYTTKAEDLVSKIKRDIDSCLNETKTGVTRNQIHRIILCFNSRLTIAQETEIQSYIADKSIYIDLIGIDTLAIEIMSKYMILSRDFLDIPIDTGQILPIDQFVTEYNYKAHQLSTPLDNIFLHRTKELEEISNSLSSENLIILSGTAGIGKTKIALESLTEFLQKNPGYQAFVIAKKDVDIYADLRVNLLPDKDYVLLIDDANRQLPNLQQILGVFKEPRKGKLKIIITVRNYALADIEMNCNEYLHKSITIPKFTDEEIIDILKSDSFRILNSEYQNKIIAIADGNVRLAIMAARLANEKEEGFLRGDVYNLFDTYFKTFVKDFNLFENKTLLKTLALVSFFFTLDRSNKEFITTILKLFEIDYYEFNESIEELHKRELIEVQFNHARISEQVMATYFFYKVFIKDQLLSFKTLLFNYFPVWKSRFKDSIIPANNSFGYENVISKIDDTLNLFMESLRNDDGKLLNFLDLFWFYKQDEMLSYFYTQIMALPEPVNSVYETHYETNDYVWDKEQTLDFITRLYDHPTESLQSAIELGFEYIRKKPEHLPEFIRRIREHILFDTGDEQTGFYRQQIFLDTLISNIQAGKPHYTAAFFALSKTFLQHTFQQTRGGRKHTFTMYEYPLPMYEGTEKMRTGLWQTLFANYEKYPNEVFEVIKAFKPSHHHLVPEIMDFDLSLLIPFIREKLSPNNFLHTYYVNDMVYWNDREKGITNREYQQLKPLFTTEEYLDFCKFDWNKFRDKDEFDYDFSNRDEYDRLKTEELKRHFIFTNPCQFPKLFTAIDNKLSLRKNNNYHIGRSLDIIVEENFLCNQEVGFLLLQELIDRYPTLEVLYRTMGSIVQSSQEWSNRLWETISNLHSANGQTWRIHFFNYLPNEYINEAYYNHLLKTIKSIKQCAYLYIECYVKFECIDNLVIKNILQIVSDKIASEDITITFSDHVFEDLIWFEGDYALIKQSYFQQARCAHQLSFDYHGKGFQAIFERFPRFLIDFSKEFYTVQTVIHKENNRNLSFIWNSVENLGVIKKTCNLLIASQQYYGIGEHPIDIFFNHLDNPQKENATLFFEEYIRENQHNSHTLNILFGAIRHGLPHKFEYFLHYFLSINPDPELFKKIEWVENVGVVSGHVIFGELYAGKWNKILDMVNKSPHTLEMIPIKTYLKKTISDHFKSAETERRHRFSMPDW